MSRILDPEFKYTSSAGTDISETWKRFGFKPTTKADRAARRKPKPLPKNVQPMAKRKAA